MTDVFISYKREERADAKALADALWQHGFSVWWDVELLPGQRFRREITQILDAAQAAVVIWSRASVQSDFVIDEAQRALERGILVPVRIDDCTLPLGHGQVQALDLRAWNRQADAPELQALITALRRLVPAAQRPADTPAADLATEEARQWRRLSEHRPASAAAYREHLRRFGEQALFAGLAHARLAELQSRRATQRRWLVLAGGTGLLAAAAGGWWLRDTPQVLPPAALAPQAAASASVPAAVPAPAVQAADAAAAARTESPAAAVPPRPASRPAAARPATARPDGPAQVATAPPSVHPPAAPAEARAPALAPVFVRDAEISVRFAAADQARADAVLQWLAARQLKAASVRAYMVPASVANRIYFSPDFADAAAWLRAGLEGTATLALQPFDTPNAEERQQIRIVIGP